MINCLFPTAQEAPDFFTDWVTPVVYTAVAPVLLALFAAALRSLAGANPPNLDTVVDISIDLAIAAIGASGEAFKAHAGGKILWMDATTAIYLFLLLNVTWIGVLFCIKKFWHITNPIACGCLFLSSFALMVGLIRYTGNGA